VRLSGRKSGRLGDGIGWTVAIRPSVEMVMAAGGGSGDWQARKEEHRHGAGQEDLGDQEDVSTALPGRAPYPT
jgi:hypothetical protein